MPNSGRKSFTDREQSESSALRLSTAPSTRWNESVDRGSSCSSMRIDYQRLMESHTRRAQVIAQYRQLVMNRRVQNAQEIQVEPSVIDEEPSEWLREDEWEQIFDFEEDERHSLLGEGQKGDVRKAEEEDRRMKADEEERRLKEEEERKQKEKEEEEERQLRKAEEEVRKLREKEEAERKLREREEKERKLKLKEKEEEERKLVRRREDERKLREREEEEGRSLREREKEKRLKLKEREEEERKLVRKKEEERKWRERKEEERRLKQKSEEDQRFRQKEEMEKKLRPKHEKERVTPLTEEAVRELHPVGESYMKLRLKPDEDGNHLSKDRKGRRHRSSRATSRRTLSVASESRTVSGRTTATSRASAPLASGAVVVTSLRSKSPSSWRPSCGGVGMLPMSAVARKLSCERPTLDSSYRQEGENSGSARVQQSILYGWVSPTTATLSPVTNPSARGYSLSERRRREAPESADLLSKQSTPRNSKVSIREESNVERRTRKLSVCLSTSERAPTSASAAKSGSAAGDTASGEPKSSTRNSRKRGEEHIPKQSQSQRKSEVRVRPSGEANDPTLLTSATAHTTKVLTPSHDQLKNQVSGADIKGNLRRSASDGSGSKQNDWTPRLPTTVHEHTHRVGTRDNGVTSHKVKGVTESSNRVTKRSCGAGSTDISNVPPSRAPAGSTVEEELLSILRESQRGFVSSTEPSVHASPLRPSTSLHNPTNRDACVASAAALLQGILRRNREVIPCYYCSEMQPLKTYSLHLNFCRTKTSALYRRYGLSTLRLSMGIPTRCVPEAASEATREELDAFTRACYECVKVSIIPCPGCGVHMRVHDLPEHAEACKSAAGSAHKTVVSSR